MNYEERYKEALDLMKDCVPDENGLVHVHPEDIFPELRESEDDRIRKGIIRNLEYLADRAEGFVKDELKERIAWLEKQGTSYTKKDIDDAYVEGMAFAKNELEKQKTDWSEEDEKMIRGLIVICDEWTTRHSFYPIENCEIEKLKNWLESLKERCTWKPSEEQMEALKTSFLYWNGTTKEVPCTESLESLYEQLKQF